MPVSTPWNHYKVVRGSRCVINYGDIGELTGKPDLIEEGDMKRLEECIDQMDNTGCLLTVEEIFRKIQGDKNVSPLDLQILDGAGEESAGGDRPEGV